MLSLKVFCGRMDLFLNQLVCMASQLFENSNWVQMDLSLQAACFAVCWFPWHWLADLHVYSFVLSSLWCQVSWMEMDCGQHNPNKIAKEVPFFRKPAISSYYSFLLADGRRDIFQTSLSSCPRVAMSYVITIMYDFYVSIIFKCTLQNSTCCTSRQRQTWEAISSMNCPGVELAWISCCYCMLRVYMVMVPEVKW